MKKQKQLNKAISLFAWLGAVALCAAPFFINTVAGKIIAIFGLTALLPQVIQKRAFNLVLLNCVGIVGYLWEIFT